MYTATIQTQENLFTKSFDTFHGARTWVGGMIIINPTAAFSVSDPHGTVVL